MDLLVALPKSVCQQSESAQNPFRTLSKDNSRAQPGSSGDQNMAEKHHLIGYSLEINDPINRGSQVILGGNDHFLHQLVREAVKGGCYFSHGFWQGVKSL